MKILNKLKLASNEIQVGDSLNLVIPNESGTFALTSDIPNVSSFATKSYVDEKGAGFIQKEYSGIQTISSDLEFKGYVLVDNLILDELEIESLTASSKVTLSGGLEVSNGLVADSIKIGDENIALAKDIPDISGKANKTEVDAALDTKANDSDVVKLTGDQEISGTKTFIQIISDNFSLLGKNFYTDNYTYNFFLPEKSGTIALLDDVSAIDLTKGGTINGSLTIKSSQPISLSANGEIRADMGTFSTLSATNGGAVQKVQTGDYAIPNVRYLIDNYVQKSDITNVYKYVGSVDNYSDLPTNLTTSDSGKVYNIVNADATNNISEGDNVAWTGSSWDKLGGSVDLSNYIENGSDANLKSVSVSKSSSGKNLVLTAYDNTTAYLGLLDTIPPNENTIPTTLMSFSEGNVGILAPEAIQLNSEQLINIQTTVGGVSIIGFDGVYLEHSDGNNMNTLELTNSSSAKLYSNKGITIQSDSIKLSGNSTNASRPTYNDSPLALTSDIPDTSNFLDLSKNSTTHTLGRCSGLELHDGSSDVLRVFPGAISFYINDIDSGCFACGAEINHLDGNLSINAINSVKINKPSATSNFTPSNSTDLVTKKYVDDNYLSLSDLNCADLRVSSVVVCTEAGHHDALVVMDTDGKCILDIDNIDKTFSVGVPIQYTGLDKIVISESGCGYSGGSTGNETSIFVTDEAVIDYVNEKFEDFDLNGFEYNFPIECKCGYIKTSSGELEFYDGAHNRYAYIGLCQNLNIESCRLFIDSYDSYFSRSIPTVNCDLTIDYDNQLTTKKYVDNSINSKLGTVFKYKGNSTYESLLEKVASSCLAVIPQVGDVYNLTTASGDYKVGDNVVWDGSDWDKLAATVDTSNFVDKTSTTKTTLNSDLEAKHITANMGMTVCGCLDIENSVTAGNVSVTTSLSATTINTCYLSVDGCLMAGTLSIDTISSCDASFCGTVQFVCGSNVSFKGSVTFSSGCSEDEVIFNVPVEFENTVSINELAVQELSLESLNVGEELTINDVPVLGSIEALQKKTGVFTQVLPAKSPTNGITEYQVVFNTDPTKTVVAPPNVVVTDITGAREKYVLVTTEWDENTVYLTFELNEEISSNTYKVYITNIQLA